MYQRLSRFLGDFCYGVSPDIIFFLNVSLEFYSQWLRKSVTIKLRLTILAKVEEEDRRRTCRRHGVTTGRDNAQVTSLSLHNFVASV